jgi:hypothetical protein
VPELLQTTGAFATSRVEDTLIFLGLLAMAAAYLWWFDFYTRVLGSQHPLPLECLYQTSGPCSVVTTVVAWAGVTSYEPILFWGGAVAFGGGLFMKLESMQTGRERRRNPESPNLKPPEKIEPHF